MIQEFTTECGANPHTHLRELVLIREHIERCVEGGVDVLLPMPNLTNPLLTAADVTAYIAAAKASVRQGVPMTFIPIVYLTQETTREMIDDCIQAGIMDAKVYPRFRTTKSDAGVKEYGKIIDIVRHCGTVGMRVHFHPEHPWPKFESDDAEFLFLPILKIFLEETAATIISEHGSDARCIPFWEDMALSNRFYVTLTPHHLATTKDKTFGDVRSTCKPPIKTERDRKDLVDLVCKDYDWVMLGADDAPHDVSKKHVHEGCCACGAYTSPFLLPLCAHALDAMIQKDVDSRVAFENFISHTARILYNLPQAKKTLTLVRKPFRIPLQYKIGTTMVEPFWAGQEILWSFAEAVSA